MPAESSSTPAWRNEYPFESNFLSIGATGHRLNYVDHGPKSPKGGPVLFVHGNPTWSFYYRNLIKAVGESRRAIGLDNLGCGLSDKPGNYCLLYTSPSPRDRG